LTGPTVRPGQSGETEHLNGAGDHMYAGQTIRMVPEIERALLLEGDSAIERERIATLIAQLRESAAKRTEPSHARQGAPVDSAVVAR
jgi:hypothetical protein